MPYQLWQQSWPVHELKMPRYGSLRADRKARSARRSDGGQHVAVEISRRRSKTTTLSFMVKYSSFVTVLGIGDLMVKEEDKRLWDINSE